MQNKKPPDIYQDKFHRWIVSTMENLNIDTGANVKIEIDKLYGSLCASSVRVHLEYKDNISDWVIENLNVKTGQWDEMARWDCQKDFDDELNEMNGIKK